MAYLNMNKEETKYYAFDLLVSRMTEEEMKQSIADYQKFIGFHPVDSEEALYWKERINDTECYMKSEKFLKGDYPQSLDQIILSILDMRMLVNAFREVHSDDNPFDKYPFFKTWSMGMTYAIFSKFGKLSNRSDKQSLIAVWGKSKDYLVADELCAYNETLVIDQRINALTNSQSLAVKFRNKVIAHNELSLRIEWDDLDKELQLLARIWGLLTKWTGSMFNPYMEHIDMFEGMNPYYSEKEMSDLRESRKQYISKFKSWVSSPLTM